MNWLLSLFGKSARTDDDGDNGRWWPMPSFFSRTTSGVTIDSKNAYTISAYWCGVRILAEAKASLTLDLRRVYTKEGRRASEDRSDHRLYSLLNYEPNPEMDAFVFDEMMTAWAIGWGNAYAEIVRNEFDEIVELWPIHPSRIPECNIKRSDTGQLYYLVNTDDGRRIEMQARNIFHYAGPLSENGISGKSTVMWMADTLGVAKATADHTAAFFKNGATPGIVVEAPGNLSPDVRKELRESWKDLHAGSKNAHNMLLLWGGAKANPIDINPSDAQLLESRQFSVGDVARALKLPPHMLGDLDRATWKNIEEQNIQFVVHSLGPWLQRWQSAVCRQLLTPAEKSERLEPLYRVEEMTRGDMKSFVDAEKALMSMAVHSPNDVRERLGENPIPGGDTYFIAGNNLVPLNIAVTGEYQAAKGKQGSTQNQDDKEDDVEDDNESDDDSVE